MFSSNIESKAGFQCEDDLPDSWPCPGGSPAPAWSPAAPGSAGSSAHPSAPPSLPGPAGGAAAAQGRTRETEVIAELRGGGETHHQSGIPPLPRLYNPSADRPATSWVHD